MDAEDSAALLWTEGECGRAAQRIARPQVMQGHDGEGRCSADASDRAATCHASEPSGATVLEYEARGSSLGKIPGRHESAHHHLADEERQCTEPDDSATLASCSSLPAQPLLDGCQRTDDVSSTVSRTAPAAERMTVDCCGDASSCASSQEGSLSEAKCCRICFESEAGEPLIAPCECKGTQKYVHRSCLDTWRAAKEGFAFAHCTECRAAFVLRAQVPQNRWWLRFKFKLCVALDHATVFVAVQIFVALLATFTYVCFGEQLRRQLGYEDRPSMFLALSGALAVAVGVLYGYFISIICSDHIDSRHFYILQRQALTKEFLVEDLESNTAGVRRSLAREHEQELAALGLL